MNEDAPGIDHVVSETYRGKDRVQSFLKRHALENRRHSRRRIDRWIEGDRNAGRRAQHPAHIRQ